MSPIVRLNRPHPAESISPELVPGAAPENTMDERAEWVGGQWTEDMASLCGRIRDAVRAELARAFGEGGSAADVSREVGQGAGDVTFAIDEVAEAEVSRWLDEVGARTPLSLMTEDAGWRHRRPGPHGTAVEADDFDHGGPRLILDPIDGTRPLMHDLRPAWVVLGAAGPGAGQPTLADLDAGHVVEIPDTRGGIGRVLHAARGGGAFVHEVDLRTGAASPDRPVRVDDDGRVTRGHFPFFGFTPIGRAQAQALARDVFAAAGRIDDDAVYDDQLCSSGGQFALLALGTYRAIVDARVQLNRLHGTNLQTAKPYDVAGGILVAQEAGCPVELPTGVDLEFPLDATTPVEFAAYHNAATRAAFAPALADVLSRPPARG